MKTLIEVEQLKCQMTCLHLIMFLKMEIKEQQQDILKE